MQAEDRTIRVVAAVIERGGRYLVARRPLHKRHGGLWEFPGGKLIDGESVEEATRRELLEELDLTLGSVGRTLFVRTDPGSPFQIEFVEVEADGEPRALEHQEVAWLGLGDLVKVSLAPTDEAFVEFLGRVS